MCRVMTMILIIVALDNILFYIVISFDCDSLRGLKVRFGARCSDFNLVSCLIDLDKVDI